MERTQTRAPHTTPRTAVVWQVLSAELQRQAGRRLRVLDVGGGTGGFAVPLAEAGHEVTVVDASPDALAALTRRAEEAGVPGRITAVQGDADRLGDLVPSGSADLVLCHSLLEVVDDPIKVLRALAASLRTGGAASILVANRPAAVLNRAVGGHLGQAAAVLNDPDGRFGQDTLRRRFEVADISAFVVGAGLTVEEIHGIRVLADLVSPPVAEADPAALIGLERALAGHPPYRDIAAQLHLFGRRAAR